MFQTKVVEKNQSTHFGFSIYFFFSETRAVYEMMRKNIVNQVRPQITIRRMRIAFWIRKGTNTHSQYVIPLDVSRQQWLHEHASVLHTLTVLFWIESFVVVLYLYCSNVGLTDMLYKWHRPLITKVANLYTKNYPFFAEFCLAVSEMFSISVILFFLSNVIPFCWI